MRERDRGSMAILMLMVVVALTAAVAGALIPVVERLGAQQRAQAAADAAALAGVDGGQSAAGRLAVANGATLVEWSSTGPDDARTVTVTVDAEGERASARATNGP